MKSKQLHSLILDDRYEIQQKLSHKAGRQTLLAKNIESQELVIIKLLQFDSLFQWDDLKLFEREAKTLKNLNHPAIPKYLDYFEVEARRGFLAKCNQLVEVDTEEIRGFALVQTYIDAPSLQDAIQQGRKFTEAELIELAQKLLKILDYLHSCNPPIIHRDIKPSNILISNRTGNSIGELYLVDFGSVQTAASKGEGTITIVGSYGYIPLEQFGGQTTTASDLYSLGMTLIYIITGVHPAELPQDNGRVQFKDSLIGDGLQRWLVKMTEPYLGKRFDSAKSAQTALLSKEQSSGSFINLKPSNSKIRLIRYQDKLEIVFTREVITPRPSEKIAYVFLGLLFIGLTYLLQFSTQIWFLYFLIATFVWIKKFAKSALYDSPETYYDYEVISINSNKSVKWTNYSGKSYKQRESSHIQSTEELNLIVYNPGYAIDDGIGSNVKKVDFNSKKIPHKLSLHTDKQEYIIGNHRQSKLELFWLGKEISNFLELELQVVNTTSTISLENSTYLRLQPVKNFQLSDSFISTPDYYY